MLKSIRVTLLLLPGLLLANSSFGLELEGDQLVHGQGLSQAQVFNGFGCKGDNQSPQLSWSDVPEGTKSFALTVYDPDAPTGSGWWHCILYNIPADTRSLAVGAGKENSNLLPAGSVQGRNDYGNRAFGGACPPAGHGKHRYQFKLTALDVEKLELGVDASAALIGFMLNSHSIESTLLEAVYQR